MAQPSRTLVLTLTAVTDKFRKGIGDADKSLNTFGDKLGKFAKRAGVALAAFGAAAGALAIKVGKDAVLAASDLAEEVSKADVVFGESAASINAWAEASATAFGQSRRQATAAASNFAIFGKSAGLTGEELVDFSTGFTELASDLASFNNTSPEDAVQALGAALRGESEPIRRYGVLLNEQSLRQKAFELGIISTTTQALQPQQRVLAAQQLILEQTSDAQGDFARTSDGLANSQRILAANLEDVKAVIGEALLPVAEQFTGWIVRSLPTILEFASEMGEKLGPAIQRVGDFIRDTLLPAAIEVWPHIRDFAKWVGELVVNFVEFLREEIFPRALQLIRDLEEPATNAYNAVKDMAGAIKDLRIATQAANPEGSMLLDWVFNLGRFISENMFLDKIETFANIIRSIAEALERIQRFRSPFGRTGGGGDFELPEGFVPGQIVPSVADLEAQFPTNRAPVRTGIPGTTLRRAETIINNNVTINGPVDSEAAAREIRRVLDDSTRRVGFQPARAN
jgi:hypothetical protein